REDRRLMGRLSGKFAIVVGGSAGIGLESARRLASEGARIVIVGRRKEVLDAAIPTIGQDAAAIQADVSKLDDIEHLFTKVAEMKARIDILFVNAGHAENAALGEITESHFDKQFDLNVKGVVFTVQGALPLLNDNASVILTGSAVGSRGYGARSIYSATKAAIRSLARTWTTDLKHRRIRVIVVSPGTTDTPGQRRLSNMDG